MRRIGWARGNGAPRRSKIAPAVRPFALALAIAAGLAAPAARAADDAQAPAPLPPPGEMERCYLLIRAGQQREARSRLEPIVALHPQWQRAVFFLGLSYHEEQRYAEARPLFEQALALGDRTVDVPGIRVHYGWTLYYLGAPDEAREQFARFLELRPGYADAHFALGLLDFDADDVEGAEGHLRKAIDFARADADGRTEGKARARLSDVLVRRGDLEGARRELERAVELRPDAYEAYFKLSRVLTRLGDDEGAARALAKHEEVREQVRPTAPPESP